MIEAGRIRFTSPFDVTSGGQFSLSEAARAWSTLWSTMQAIGWTPGTGSTSSRPVRVSWKHGSGSCLSSLTPNPQFYERTMGWPIGWTAPAGQVTEYAAWLRHSHGLFSRLLMNWTIDEVMGATAGDGPPE